MKYYLNKWFNIQKNQVIWNREQLNKICKLNRGYFGDTNFIIFVQFIVGCSKACLKEIFDIKRLSEILKNKKDKIVVVEFASISINKPEALGVKSGTISTEKLVILLKMLVFDYVFDTNFTAEITIVEEATEFV